MIRNAKYEYEKSLAVNINSDNKSFWKYVKSKTKTKDGISDLLNEDGKLSESDAEKADILNKFFCSVFTNENISNIPTLINRTTTILDDITFTEEKVFRCLEKLKVSKSPGPDGIHNKVLFELRHVLCKPLTKFFNLSMRTSTFPMKWKEANVTALFKKGNKNLTENYRPVSLTSTVCKIMESLVKKELMEYMEFNNLFSIHQHGFRSGHSCITQLLEVIEMWTSAIDKKENIDIIYLDFRKAFDTVPFERLLNKLMAYGINGCLLRWIGNFLKDRRQRVTVNGQSSTWSDVVSGVPQGSVLGPALFLIFINDLPDIVQNLVKIFADDTKLFSTVKTQEDCDSIQNDLNSLSTWSDQWQLKFNASKCKRMHIGYTNQQREYSMLEEGRVVNISEITEEKDLGVTFTNDLKFSRHIEISVNKANKMIGIIKRTFTYMEKDMFLQLYKSLIRPHLEYGSVIWSPYLKKDIYLIENLQRRATKLVKEIKDLPYENRLKFLGLPTLKYRRERADVIQVFKIVKQIDNLNTELFFQKTDYSKTRGHNYKLRKAHNRLRIRHNVFSQRAIDAWNDLPYECVNSDSLNSFKSALNRAWKNKPGKFSSVITLRTPNDRATTVIGAKMGQNKQRLQ